MGPTDRRLQTKSLLMTFCKAIPPPRRRVCCQSPCPSPARRHRKRAKLIKRKSPERTGQPAKRPKTLKRQRSPMLKMAVCRNRHRRSCRAQNARKSTQFWGALSPRPSLRLHSQAPHPICTRCLRGQQRPKRPSPGFRKNSLRSCSLTLWPAGRPGSHKHTYPLQHARLEP